MSNDANENTESSRTTGRPLLTAGTGTPHRGAPGPVAPLPHAPGNEELRWMQEHETNTQKAAGNRNDSTGTILAVKTPRKRVQRKTCLRGQSIDPPRYPKQTIRSQTEKDLEEKDPDIPYIIWEKAMKDLICSLIERQDRFFRNFLLRVGDLEFRVEDLERDMHEHLETSKEGPGGVTG